MSRRRLLASAPLYVASAPAIVHMSAYANTLTRMIPDLYAGLEQASRELVGFIPSAFRNASAERAAVNQEVVYPTTVSKGLVDVVPAMVVPEPSDTSFGNGTIKITKSKAAEFGWTGEEQRGVNFGPGYLSLQAMAFADGIRQLCNAIETDLAVEAAANASRAYGTAGATPFQTNTGETAQLKKILDDNGAPLGQRSLIIDTSAGAALRTLANLTKANEAGGTMTLRDGELLNLNAFSIKESAQVQSITAGTAAGATTTAAAFAKGATVIALASAGTGTIPAGSAITFAGDLNKYVVAVGDTDVSNGGSITLVAPGLRQAIPAAATAITMVGTHVANIAFAGSALHLVARAPALPSEGDIAMDRRLLTDPRSGLVFEVSLYPGYRKVRSEIAMAWGVKAVQPNHIAMLLG